MHFILMLPSIGNDLLVVPNNMVSITLQCLCVRTGPTSFIDISVYPSEEAAEANLEDRQKSHEEAFGSALKNDCYYQGDIGYFFQSTSLSELDLKEYRSFLMPQPNGKWTCHGTRHGRS